MKSVNVAIKAILKIKRPNGDIEFVTCPNIKFISPANLETIKKATLEANGSIVISVENVSEKKYGQSVHQALNSMTDKTVENMGRMGE